MTSILEMLRYFQYTGLLFNDVETCSVVHRLPDKAISMILVSSSEEICISSWDTSDKEDGLTMQFWRTLQRFPSRLDFI